MTASIDVGMSSSRAVRRRSLGDDPVRYGVRFFFGRAKVRRGDRVDRVLRLPRHLQEGTRVGRCRVALPRSPPLPFDRGVVKVLLRRPQQIVEAVDLRPGVGQAAASLHHRVKVVVVLGLERDEERDDRIPRIGSPRPHQIAAHFTLEPSHRRSFTHRLVTICRLVITLGGWFEDARVEYTQVTAEADDHEVRVEGGDGACRHRVSGVHQHFEPFAEAIDIELFVASRLRVAPQIEVEQGGELRGRRGRDELAARIESAVLNELMQRLRREVRDDPREEWRVQETREPTIHSLSTWTGDDTRPADQQTVLKIAWCGRILLMGSTFVIPPRPPGLTYRNCVKDSAMLPRKGGATCNGAYRRLPCSPSSGVSSRLRGGRRS